MLREVSIEAELSGTMAIWLQDGHLHFFPALLSATLSVVAQLGQANWMLMASIVAGGRGMNIEQAEKLGRRKYSTAF